MAGEKDHGAYELGIDVGGTKIALLASDFDDIELDIVVVPSATHDDQQTLVESIFGAIDAYVEQRRGGTPPRAMGFGLKDAVDARRGIWLKCPSSRGFSPIALGELVRERYGCPAALDNDVHAATLAEMRFGAGKRYRDFLYMNIGTGIAVGAVCGGALVRGATNYAGEIGHISVETNGEECGFCGGWGCFENVASGEGIAELVSEGVKGAPDSALARILAREGRVTSADVFRAADAGDTLASEIAARVLRATTIACCDAINIFNPAAIIFGGGVMADGWLLRRLREEVPKHAIATSMDALEEMRLSELGSRHVGVLGALALASDAARDACEPRVPEASPARRADETLAHGEIFRAGDTLRRTFDYVVEKDKAFARLVAEYDPKELVLLGAGSSYWLSLSAAATFQRETGIRALAVKSTDVVMSPSSYVGAFERPLFVCASRSGMTAETIEAVRLLVASRQAPLVVVSEADKTPLAAMADVLLLEPWAHEESVMQTRSFCSLYLTLVLLAAGLSGNEALVRDLRRYVDGYEWLAADASERTSEIRERGFAECEYVVSLGSGCQYGVAIEGAYVQQEIGAQRSGFFGTLEYRHGPFVTNAPDTLFCLLSCGDPNGMESRVAAELVRRGGRLLVVEAQERVAHADYRFCLGWQAMPETVALYGAMVCQGLALYQALKSGIDPDNPSGNPDKTPYVTSV